MKRRDALVGYKPGPFQGRPSRYAVMSENNEFTSDERSDYYNSYHNGNRWLIQPTAISSSKFSSSCDFFTPFCTHMDKRVSEFTLS